MSGKKMGWLKRQGVFKTRGVLHCAARARIGALSPGVIAPLPVWHPVIINDFSIVVSIKSRGIHSLHPALRNPCTPPLSTLLSQHQGFPDSSHFEGLVFYFKQLGRCDLIRKFIVCWPLYQELCSSLSSSGLHRKRRLNDCWIHIILPWKTLALFWLASLAWLSNADIEAQPESGSGLQRSKTSIRWASSNDWG